MTDTCSSCRFWIQTDWVEDDQGTKTVTHGECRRFPPQVVQVGAGRRATGFPIIAPDCGCGEHKSATGGPRMVGTSLTP